MVDLGTFGDAHIGVLLKVPRGFEGDPNPAKFPGVLDFEVWIVGAGGPIPIYAREIVGVMSDKTRESS